MHLRKYATIVKLFTVKKRNFLSKYHYTCTSYIYLSKIPPTSTHSCTRPRMATINMASWPAFPSSCTSFRSSFFFLLRMSHIRLTFISQYAYHIWSLLCHRSAKYPLHRSPTLQNFHRAAFGWYPAAHNSSV